MTKLKFVVPAVAACLAFASSSFADTYTETGDAGDLPATAQIVSGPANTPLTLIIGSLTLTNGTSDGGMYQIFITNPTAFSASTTGFFPGANNFDTQIFLFNSQGVGVVANDDAASGGSQSNIAAGSFSGLAGVYYLAIGGSGRYPTSTGGLIFPNLTDGKTDPTVTYGPTGPGGAQPITSYTGSSNEGTNYRITLTGAQFVVVPEPGSALYVLAGLAGLGWTLRARRARRPARA